MNAFCLKHRNVNTDKMLVNFKGPASLPYDIAVHADFVGS